MMTKIKIISYSIFLMGLSFQPLFAQEGIIKDLLESKRDKKFAFYPSTLRMVNIKQNQEYNKLVSGVEKLLIYTLDSATIADKSYTQVVEAYTASGFEEYVMAFGGDMNLALLGKVGRNTNEFVGYSGMNDMTIAFYLRGNIAWQKIPELLKSIREEDFINFLQ